MPTPFMHLQMSEELRSLALSRQDFNGRLRNVLVECWPAYFLGSVAPDYQTICGLPRAKTHFYKMPPESKSGGPQNMLALYPDLCPGNSLDPDQAGFVAAYLVHLQLDLLWHFDVVLPYFTNSSLFDHLPMAYMLHLLLLTYLDNLAFQALPETAEDVLAAARYDHWLPFADDDQVNAWRAFLVEQLAPGATTQTVHIFAGRLQMTPDEFSAKLNTPDWMNEELFSRIPVAAIQRRLQDSIPESLDLIKAYWYGNLN